MTLKELSQLYQLNREIEEYERKLYELQSAAESTTQTITGMPHGCGVSDKVGKYATEICYYKEAIEINKQKCWNELKRLNEYINSIDDSLTRQVFAFRFVNGLSWFQVAQSVGNNTEDSVKKVCYRYIQKHKES